MKDRVSSGFISGVIAGIAMNIIDWTGFLLGLHKEQLLHWAAVAIFGHLPVNVFETIFSQVGQLFFAGILGIIFSYILLKLTSGNYLAKGWFYGITSWFGLYAVSIALKLPTLTTHTLNTAVTHFISSSIYGLTLALVLNLLDKRQVE